MATSDCPLCGTEMMKVIYMALPGRLCANGGCNCVTGLAAYAPPISGPDGFAFMVYQGGYWPALWHWLFGGA